MAWDAAPIASHAEALGANGGTTSGIDTSGADSLFLMIGYAGGTPPAVSDSKSNTWTQIDDKQDGSGHHGALYYVQAPATVGSSHTFTATQSGANIGIAVSAWKAGKTSSMLDLHSSGANNFSSTIQPGSITPSADNYLVMYGSAETDNGVSFSSIDSSFTIDVSVAGGGFSFGAALAYQVQTTATARNPTMTMSAGTLSNIAIIASFIPAAGGGGGGRGLFRTPPLSGLGIGGSFFRDPLQGAHA